MMTVTRRNTVINTGRRKYSAKSLLLKKRRRFQDWSDTEQSPEEIERILSMGMISKQPQEQLKGCLKPRFSSSASSSSSSSSSSPPNARTRWPSPFSKRRARSADSALSKDKENARQVQIKEPSKKSLEDLRALYGDQGIGGFRPTRDIYLMAKRVKQGLPPLPVREAPKVTEAKPHNQDDQDDEDEYLSIKPKTLLRPPSMTRSKSPPLRSASNSPARSLRTSSPASISRHRKNRSPDTRSPKFAVSNGNKPRFVDLANNGTNKKSSESDDNEEDEYEDVSSGASTPERVNPPVLPFTALHAIPLNRPQAPSPPSSPRPPVVQLPIAT